MAPYEDKSWEIWVLGNRLDRHIERRVSRVFEIHNNLSEHGDIQKYSNWLLSHGLPIIVGDRSPIVGKDVTPFPYDDVERTFGQLYLTSSPAYMVAYALLIGASELAIYGVDLSINDHEYFWQRPCMEWWIGLAKGILGPHNITIPSISHVGKSSYVEGRDWNGDTEVGVFSEDGFNAQAADCATKREALQRQRQDLALKAAALDGAEQVYKHLGKVARAVEAQMDVKSLTETTVLR